MPNAHEKPQQPPRENNFVVWLKNNKLVAFLLLLIIIGGIYAIIRINQSERQASRERHELVSRYESSIDSLYIEGMERTARAFTWAVRSELGRQNIEQVDQFFTNFIREQGIQRIMLVDPQTGDVILSTDRKDQGTYIEDRRVLEAQRVFSRQQDTIVQIISPVTGLDELIGILIFDVSLR
jgi:hypothetical protein